jgi:prepilin-type N-terminal cleavage/methylation domain-containing protein
VTNITREDGFTITELLISTTIVLIVLSGALQTFNQGLQINDAGTQLADANQNLRAGTNQLVRDIMMAGRIIGTDGVSMPTGAGITFARPGPTTLNFDLVADTDSTLQMPSIQSGYQLGPTVNGAKTDIITILTIDEFMPVVVIPNPAPAPASLAVGEGILSADGTNVTLSATSQWLVGDTVADTPMIQVGDLVFYKNANGNAIQTVTRKDATHIYFDANNSNDFFHFNQPTATTAPGRPLQVMKGAATIATDAWTSPPAAAAAPQVTLFKALMITYYVDNTTVAGTPRLTRVINHFAAQALAGVVEDLDLSYDLVDGVVNPVNVGSLPYTLNSVVYSASQIRKVNIHMGVRSEVMSKPAQDYVRNHISTSVNVRSLVAIDRYTS